MKIILENKGVSLITLVITIVLILVLSGITIMTFNNSNTNVLKRLANVKENIVNNVGDSQDEIDDLKNISADSSTGLINQSIGIKNFTLNVLELGTDYAKIKGKSEGESELDGIWFVINVLGSNTNTNKVKADTFGIYNFTEIAGAPLTPNTKYRVLAYTKEGGNKYVYLRDITFQTKPLVVEEPEEEPKTVTIKTYYAAEQISTDFMQADNVQSGDKFHPTYDFPNGTITIKGYVGETINYTVRKNYYRIQRREVLNSGDDFINDTEHEKLILSYVVKEEDNEISLHLQENLIEGNNLDMGIYFSHQLQWLTEPQHEQRGDTKIYTGYSETFKIKTAHFKYTASQRRADDSRTIYIVLNIGAKHGERGHMHFQTNYGGETLNDQDKFSDLGKNNPNLVQRPNSNSVFELEVDPDYEYYSTIPVNHLIVMHKNYDQLYLMKDFYFSYTGIAK